MTSGEILELMKALPEEKENKRRAKREALLDARCERLLALKPAVDPLVVRFREAWNDLTFESRHVACVFANRLTKSHLKKLGRALDATGMEDLVSCLGARARRRLCDAMGV